MLNGAVIVANAGAMPVVDMPSAVRPISPMWKAASSKTELSLLADQAHLGLFSIGDLVMLLGGSLIVVVTYLNRASKMKNLLCSAVKWIPMTRPGAGPAFRPR